MSQLDKIKIPIKAELEKFNTYFSDTMRSDISLLNIVVKYLLKRKGKQIRPILVFLTAKLIDKTKDSTYTAATLIELLHTATLIHDDVVDNSYERRGFLSINALYKSKLAVLIGDYFLSRGLDITISTGEFYILSITNGAVKEMVEGEMLQMQKSRKLNIDEEDYYKIIRKKTATLIAACTAAGARSVTDDKATVQKMHDFGIMLGMAFQIKDDLFDYEKNSVTGKPKGNDIQEKKITLPLIIALKNADLRAKNRILRLINKKSSKKKTFGEVYKFVHENQGFSYAKEKMQFFKKEALSVLKNFPENDANKSLQQLIEFIVNRNS